MILGKHFSLSCVMKNMTKITCARMRTNSEKCGRAPPKSKMCVLLTWPSQAVDFRYALQIEFSDEKYHPKEFHMHARAQTLKNVQVRLQNDAAT